MTSQYTSSSLNANTFGTKEQFFPCSAVQQSFWFMNAVNPGDPAYNIALRWEILGRFSLSTLEKAFQTIIDRHEILRTRIVDNDGEPVQAVVDHYDFKLSVVDLSIIPEAERLDAAMALVRREARLSFDIEKLPLIRATLLRLAADRAFIAVTVHHLAFDGWSISVIAREFGLIAEALDAGKPNPLPELPLQYGDYCRWERAYFASAGFDASIAYWKSELTGAPYFEVALDHERQPGQPKGGEITAVVLPPAVGDQIDRIGSHRNVTVFVFGCAVVTAMLHRHTGRSDVLFATQSAGREDTDLEELIGPFINNLVLRFDASGDPTFEELLARTNAKVQETLAHKDMPFNKLVELLNPIRDFDRAPIASVNFTVFRDVVHRKRFGDFDLLGHPSSSSSAIYDLNFFFAHWPNGWRVALEYNPNLFEKSTADRLVASVAATLAFAFATPNARLSALTLPGEAAGAAPAANASPRAIETNEPSCAEVAKGLAPRTVDALFAARARQAGDDPAILDGAKTLSYRELDRRSNQCARRLQTLGVRPGDLVALLAQRSFEAVIAMLGVLKAGAAYAPLDPSYPKDLLAFMVEDCAPALALGQRDVPSAMAGDHHFADIESFLADASHASDAALDRDPDPNAPAYVIYTSGSTGRPKGVMIPHRGIVRLVTGQDYANFGPEEVFLHAAPLAFDASTFEIWGALLNGGRVAIIREPRPTLDEICEAIRRYGVTTAWFTAGLFHLLVDERMPDLRSLRRILAGGDVLSPTHVEKALAGLPETQLVNGYGPTENTTFTCCYPVPREGWGGGAVPIGGPIDETDVYLLGPDLQPVKNGEVGQICVGGAGVALGYLNRPELTAEKFIRNPLCGTAGERIYLTGDIGRRRSDGRILFLGRTDRQVKINGKRVELDEIEKTLQSDSRVRDAVVALREDSPAKRLTAYLKLAKPGDAAANEAWGAAIIEALRAKLPEHMIPSAVVIMEAFPLTPNGKVDRRALPQPPQRRSETAPPSAWTKIETMLADVWRDVLKVDEIDPSSNFFDLGGHSLMATRLVARVAQKFGVKVGVLALFRAPTLREFAAYLSGLEGAAEFPANRPNSAQRRKNADHRRQRSDPLLQSCPRPRNGSTFFGGGVVRSR